MPAPCSADGVCQFQPVEFDQTQLPKPSKLASRNWNLLLCFGHICCLEGASNGCGDLGIGSVDWDIQPHPTLFVVLGEDHCEIALAGTDA